MEDSTVQASGAESIGCESKRASEPAKGVVNWLLAKDYATSSVPSSATKGSTGTDSRVSNGTSGRVALRIAGEIRVGTLLSAILEVQARESSDKPRLNAFCRVAPSVRFKALAIFPAGVFLRAADFNSRTSADVHERRFEFLAI